MELDNHYDVIVIGAGHAGCEAAAAAARVGARTLLLTQSLDTVGAMSCNPAIGGIGKSHLVREIDALDGLMARAADRAGIQFRVLNASKGPAVRATRAQADRALYRQAMRELLEAQDGLHLFQQSVVDLIVEAGRVVGVVTAIGLEFRAAAVVLTTGTFLGGRMHIGMTQQAGGRAGDAPSNALAERLRAQPLRVDRLKTGTPPRIDAATVDFDQLEPQPGDEPLPSLSFLHDGSEHPGQVPCYIAETNERTHDIIRAALDRSPLYGGVIEGVGPRYCPSIEDKVVRFADRLRHQVFIEPEGLSTRELYPNGISTSLPFDVQQRLVRSMRGFEKAHITRPGYAIEYDFFDPRDLEYSLQTRSLRGLFFAGQINGTTGYEEAAAQGLLAGLNAARLAAAQDPWWPRRDQAYLGVLIDDLIQQGTLEPYRMFTSRAEFRLLLREDNADSRLTPLGRELGLVGASRWQAFDAKRTALADLQQRLDQTRLVAGSELARRVAEALGEPISRDLTAAELLKRPCVTLEALAGTLDLPLPGGPQLHQQVETGIKYAGYLKRQAEEIERIRRHEQITIPHRLDFMAVAGLSNELKQKLAEQRPATLAQAARVSGMTPAALSVLLVAARRLAGSAADADADPLLAEHSG